MRFHGVTKREDGTLEVTHAGSKYNLTDVAARVGIGQLKRLEAFNERRRWLAYRYFDLLRDADFGILPARGDEGHSWHMFTLLPDYTRFKRDRAGLRAALRSLNIGTGIHYQSVAGFRFYRERGYRPEAYPNADRIGRETITLPLFPAMQDSDVDRVCEALESLARG